MRRRWRSMPRKDSWQMSPSLRAPLLRTGLVPAFKTIDLPSPEDRRKRVRFAGVSPNSGHILPWISLNPSGKKSDGGGPTGKRMFEFAWRWGFDGVAVYNLFPIDTPNPKLLAGLLGDEVRLRENCEFIANELGGINEVIVAWGNPPRNLREKIRSLIQSLVDAANAFDQSRSGNLSMWCLGRTKNGHPRHPSPLGRVSMSTLPQPWELPRV
jgi:hypothetical protein